MKCKALFSLLLIGSCILACRKEKQDNSKEIAIANNGGSQYMLTGFNGFSVDHMSIPMNFNYSHNRLDNFSCYLAGSTNFTVNYNEQGKISYVVGILTVPNQNGGSSFIFSYDGNGNVVKVNYKMGRVNVHANDPYFGDLHDGKLADEYDSLSYDGKNRITSIYEYRGGSYDINKFFYIDTLNYGAPRKIEQYHVENGKETLEDQILITTTNDKSPFNACWFIKYANRVNSLLGNNYPLVLPILYDNPGTSLTGILPFVKKWIYNYKLLDDQKNGYYTWRGEFNLRSKNDSTRLYSWRNGYPQMEEVYYTYQKME